ncbi:MAG: hypothetical protein H8D46_03835 [FCB group bacterium]|nr:hypothetical protein [FCB group bacterium]
MKTRRSIRFKLLGWIVFTLVIILFLYSITVLNQQKKNIVQRHVSTSIALSQTAAIPVTEAFFYSSEESPVSEDFLQDYVNQLWEKNLLKLAFIIVLDSQGDVRAHTNIEEYGKRYIDIYSLSALESDSTLTHIYKDEKVGWILETTSVIGISSKKWGAIRFGFSAVPLRQELLAAFWSSFLISFLMVSSVVIATYLITSNLTRKLIQTASIVDKINLENDKLVDFPDSNDEIGRLGDNFRRMQKRLISSRRKIEEASHSLIQAEKMAAIGRLASGVAHEINNPLLGMKNCLYLIEADPHNAENLKRNIDLLDEGLDRVETIVKKLLGSVRKPLEEVNGFNINDSIMAVVELLAYRVSTNKIIVSVNLDEAVPEYNGNKVRLEEALLNILLNALDAIGEIGSLVIESTAGKENIRISIKDSGPGIPEENRHKIFDPFFTSKEVGKGTGLGLYVTREILTEMGGSIDYRTQIGIDHGTTFVITLPINKKS